MTHFNNKLSTRLDQFLANGHQHLLSGGLKGIEKESLRIAKDGFIAQTPHPAALGSALTHPYITTDYSEALIELITPPFADIRIRWTICVTFTSLFMSIWIMKYCWAPVCPAASMAMKAFPLPSTDRPI